MLRLRCCWNPLSGVHDILGCRLLQHDDDDRNDDDDDDVGSDELLSLSVSLSMSM
jgi:hypothetical protein